MTRSRLWVPAWLMVVMSFSVPALAQRPLIKNIVWYNSATGETQFWRMNGFSVSRRATVLGETGTPAHVGAPWSIVGTGDLNADGESDLVWHNSSTGETQIWHMNGDRVSGRANVLGETGTDAHVGAPWRIAGIGDFTGDGKPDLLWHNAATGESQVWAMNGFRVTGRAVVLGETGTPARVGVPWSIVAASDMNADAKSDIIWHNSSTGETQIWHMNGHRVTGRANVLGETGTDAHVGSPWRIAGSQDFNRDGKADLLWHNGTSGETQIWHMNGFRVIGRAVVLGETGRAANVASPWRIAGGLPEVAASAVATAGGTGAIPAPAAPVPAVPPPPSPILADITDVFISQVYGGGGLGQALVEYDYIEIFNRSDTYVDITGWAVQYTSAAGTTWQVTPLTGLIRPNGYYLVRQGASAGAGAASMTLPDATGTIAMGAGAGKVVLTQNTKALTVACPSGTVVVDRVGYGANGSPAGCGDEWGGRTSNLGKDSAAHRNNDGCVNTGSGSADFSVLPPNPRNSASPVKTCGP